MWCAWPVGVLWVPRRDPLHGLIGHVDAGESEQHTSVLVTIRPEMITQIIRKQFFCVTDVCVIGNQFPENSFV